jgi:hypothetical protein
MTVINGLDLLTCCADAALPDALGGRMPAGHNGPHRHPETYHRNTAHWSIAYARLFALTGEPKYRAAAHALLTGLLADPALAGGRLPVLRIAEGRDAANGVIGCGWLLEALGIAGTILAREDALAAGRRLASFFPFDAAQALWVTRELSGRLLGVDPTINHQIWHALGISCVSPGPGAEAALTAFLAGLGRHLRKTGDGYLCHLIKFPAWSRRSAVELAMSALDRELSSRLVRWAAPRGISEALIRKHRYLRSKEIGYLVFTLHALFRLRQAHKLSDALDRVLFDALGTTLGDGFVAGIAANPWSYAYNPPGFDYPLIAEMLEKDVAAKTRDALLERAKALFDAQCRMTFDRHRGVIGRNVPDVATSTARLYTLSLLSPTFLRALETEVPS